MGAAIAVVAMDDSYVSGTWRYKMTVVVETPEGIKSGSAVREVSNSTPWLGLDLPEAGNPAEVSGAESTDTNESKVTSQTKEKCEGEVILDMGPVKLKIERHQRYHVRTKDKSGFNIHLANEYFNYSCDQEVIENVSGLVWGGGSVYYRTEIKGTGYKGVAAKMRNKELKSQTIERPDGVVNFHIEGSRVDTVTLTSK